MPTPLKPERPPLLVRADADARRGTGHIMRCLALAQAWRASGGEAVFITRCHSPALRERIRAAGAGIVPLEACASAARDIEITLAQSARYETAFLVLDGYHFDGAQQRALRAAGHPLLVIDDDGHLESYHADILLNPNLGAARLNYRCSPATTLLTGPDYAMMRPEFVYWRRHFRAVPGVARKILVTLGGSDPDNFTLRVIEALAELGRPGLDVRLVVGPANPHWAVLRKAVEARALPIRLLMNVPDMAQLMTWADLAIAASGTTSWELAYLGLPAITVVLAENQRTTAAELGAFEINCNLGWHGDVSVDRLAAALDLLLYSSFRRLRMSQRGRALVDGQGAGRVVEALMERRCMKAA